MPKLSLANICQWVVEAITVAGGAPVVAACINLHRSLPGKQAPSTLVENWPQYNTRKLCIVVRAKYDVNCIRTMRTSLTGKQSKMLVFSLFHLENVLYFPLEQRVNSILILVVCCIFVIKEESNRNLRRVLLWILN